MNLLNLLTKEKLVAGIEISDSVVRIAFLRPRKNSNKNISLKVSSIPDFELVRIEEPISANIIVQGVVIDKVLLGKTLKSIWAKTNLDTNYAIVSIPDDKIYTRIFSFPKTVSGERLTEAMNLAIGFQLPMKTEDIYLDWERTTGTNLMNEILLSTIPKTVAQGYVGALEEAGIKTLAVESHLASIARAIKLEAGQTAIFTKKTPDGATVFVLKDGILRFSRTFPSQFISEDKLPAEVEKIKSALESENKNTDGHGHKTTGVVTILDLIDAQVREPYVDYPELSNQTEKNFKWLVALGAVMRGQIPEGEDNLISLLPIGTEEAYAYQKATAFVVLVRNMTIGVSIFFVFAFLATYLLMISLSQSSARAIATLSTSSVSPEILAQETRVTNADTLAAASASILADAPNWSTVVDEVNARIIDGVVVLSFQAPSITDKMSLTGTAKDRATLNLFKKSLQDSAMFTEIELPITNIEQKGDLPFSISFRLKDPKALYFK